MRAKPRRARVSDPREAGFSLIEIVIALAVLAGALVVLLEAHYGALRLYDDAREQAILRNFLEQAMGRAQVEVLAGNMGGQGKFGKRFEGYSYRFEASQTGQGAVPLYEVLVQVEGPSNRDPVSMSMMIYNPRRE